MQIKKFWRSAIAVTLFSVLVTGCGKVNASANASVADIIRQHIAEENADDEADAENKSEAGTEAEAGNRSDTESGSEAETRENSEVPTSARSEYSFELEGKTYSVPFPLTAMRENGWEPRGITWEELEEKDIGGYTISFLHFTRAGRKKRSQLLSSAHRVTDRKLLTVRSIKLKWDRHLSTRCPTPLP